MLADLSSGFATIYLPAEKILIEADTYTPAAANAPPPAAVNPFWVMEVEASGCRSRFVLGFASWARRIAPLSVR